MDEDPLEARDEEERKLYPPEYRTPRSCRGPRRREQHHGVAFL